MTNTEKEAALARIAEIDRAFEAATGWRSWMIMSANEREDLVNKLNKNGEFISHKYQARTETGGRVD